MAVSASIHILCPLFDLNNTTCCQNYLLLCLLSQVQFFLVMWFHTNFQLNGDWQPQNKSVKKVKKFMGWSEITRVLIHGAAKYLLPRVTLCLSNRGNAIII